MDLSFYRDKSVLITGHTGFKGSWMCKILTDAGARVTGYALEPPTTPSLFQLCDLGKGMRSVVGDVRDFEHLQAVFQEVRPEIVIHMAAQPLVRESYARPVYTYEVNVMGTIHVLECIRTMDCVRSFVNVTTDKVYLNREWEWGYRENEVLNGYDPYSNSKSCSELVTDSYRNSFFQNQEVAISTARAGNVIGGGDFAADRIIPDCIRALETRGQIVVRSPHSVRPYQHVLEPLFAYLLIAERQYGDRTFAGCYNVGPKEEDCWTTGELVTRFCELWNEAQGDALIWENQYDGGPHEATLLKLDCSKIKQKLGWSPRWDVNMALKKIVEWTEVYLDQGDLSACMSRQIEEFRKTVPEYGGRVR